MTYGSVCSGIEAATVAWHPLGWKPAWFSEIEPFPSAVLAHHHPTVKNHGDFTKIESSEPLDVLVGGTPCQAFSVAGNRGGLDDARGNLTLEFLRLAGRLKPRWIVWENVPGVLSIDGGRTFGTFLGTLGELGYGFAYRILDAQYFGVPQRRRRVFVVGYLGDWRPAAAVLFERHCLSGYPPPSRETRQDSTYDLAPSLTSSGRGVERSGESRGQDPVVAMCLNAKGGNGRIGAESETFIASTLKANNGGGGFGSDPLETFITQVVGPMSAAGGTAKKHGHGWGQQDWENGYIQPISVSPTLRAGGNRTGGDRPPGTDVDTADSLVVTHSLRAEGFDASEDGTGRGTPLVPVGYTIHGTDKTQKIASETHIAGSLRTKPPGVQENSSSTVVLGFSCQDHGADAGDISPTIRSMGHDGSHANVGGQVAVCFDTTQITSKANYSNPQPGDPCHPLASGAHPPAVAFQSSQSGVREVETHATLDSNNGSRRHNGVMQGMAVRRLTPRECARLQGFPDDYLDIQYRGKPAADGPRYKALGNSMAVPVMHWIGERIDIVDTCLL